MGNGFLTFADTLRFYITARSGSCAGMEPLPPRCHANGNATTGIAALRRDGFASVSPCAGAQGCETAKLVTVPLVFTRGSFLFINAIAPAGGGSVTVAVLDALTDRPLPGLAQSEAFVGDSTAQLVRWSSASNSIAAAKGKPIRLQFEMRGGPATQLFSFWVSESLCGESRGYVAGGSQDYNASTDRVGSCKPAEEKLSVKSDDLGAVLEFPLPPSVVATSPATKDSGHCWFPQFVSGPACAAIAALFSPRVVGSLPISATRSWARSMVWMTAVRTKPAAQQPTPASATSRASPANHSPPLRRRRAINRLGDRSRPGEGIRPSLCPALRALAPISPPPTRWSASAGAGPPIALAAQVPMAPAAAASTRPAASGSPSRPRALY